MYPGFAKTARDEGFDEVAEWFETLARAEKSHAGRFTQGLERRLVLSRGAGEASRLQRIARPPRPSTTSPTCAPTSASGEDVPRPRHRPEEAAPGGRRPIVTMVFENRDTIRFQIQEMARVEKLITDEAIQASSTPTTRSSPSRGSCAPRCSSSSPPRTQLREWLPKLVGIERSLVLRRSARAPTAVSVRALPEEAHADQLTREEITASVHYVRLELTAATQVAASTPGPSPCGRPPGVRSRDEL